MSARGGADPGTADPQEARVAELRVQARAKETALRRFVLLGAVKWELVSQESVCCALAVL